MAFSLLKRGNFCSNIKKFPINFETKKVHNLAPRFAAKQTQIKLNDFSLLSGTGLALHKATILKNLTTREYSSKSSKHERDYDSDSDSDDEIDRYRKGKKGHQGERGNSEFWRCKMRTLHGIFDVNKDGVVCFEDLMLLTKKFIDLGHLQPETSEEFVNVMKKTWKEQWGDIDPHNSLTANQYLVFMQHAINDKDLVKSIGRFLPYLFKAVDIDHSGHLDLEQFKLLFNCLGLTDENAAISFAILNENGDGKLRLKEFIKLGKQYFLTENERRVSKWLWGPLVVDH